MCVQEQCVYIKVFVARLLAFTRQHTQAPFEQKITTKAQKALRSVGREKKALLDLKHIWDQNNCLRGYLCMKN